MNKQQLVTKIADETKLTKADCQRVLEATIEITKKTIKKGGDLRLVGFGTFMRSKRKARRGKNPHTGQEIMIKEHYVPRFRAGREFRDYICYQHKETYCQNGQRHNRISRSGRNLCFCIGLVFAEVREP